MANKGFTHFHLHSQYSLLDGAITFDNLFKRCKKLQMDAVAVTDRIFLLRWVLKNHTILLCFLLRFLRYGKEGKRLSHLTFEG